MPQIRWIAPKPESVARPNVERSTAPNPSIGIMATVRSHAGLHGTMSKNMPASKQYEMKSRRVIRPERMGATL